MAIKSQDPKEERERLAELLPWRATNRLDAAQNAALDRALAADAELRGTLASIKDEAAETIAANERLGGPSVASFNALMAQVSAEARPVLKSGQNARSAGWLEWLLAPQGLRIAAACAAVVILLQAGAIGFMLSRSAGGGHQTASSTSVSASSLHVLAVFTEEATVSEINEILLKFGAKITDGPRADGFYRIIITKDDGKISDQEQLIGALKTSGLTVMALPGGAR